VAAHVTAVPMLLFCAYVQYPMPVSQSRWGPAHPFDKICKLVPDGTICRTRDERVMGVALLRLLT